jgi:hypothetical protein
MRKIMGIGGADAIDRHAGTQPHFRRGDPKSLGLQVAIDSQESRIAYGNHASNSYGRYQGGQ